MQLSADQIVEETSDWSEDAVADLVDRILRARYGEADPSVDKAWRDETPRRIADMESGRAQGIPIEETLVQESLPSSGPVTFRRKNDSVKFATAPMDEHGRRIHLALDAVPEIKMWGFRFAL
jgi:hypothetical protein